MKDSQMQTSIETAVASATTAAAAIGRNTRAVTSRLEQIENEVIADLGDASRKLSEVILSLTSLLSRVVAENVLALDGLTAFTTQLTVAVEAPAHPVITVVALPATIAPPAELAPAGGHIDPATVPVLAFPAPIAVEVVTVAALPAIQHVPPPVASPVHEVEAHCPNCAVAYSVPAEQVRTGSACPWCLQQTHRVFNLVEGTAPEAAIPDGPSTKKRGRSKKSS
jgi:hypothetical protein